MSTAKSRNFRRRGGDSETNDDDDSLPSKPTSSAPKPKKPQAPKRLSFADDENENENDNEIPRSRSSKSKPHRSGVAKPSSSSSHKITTHKDRIAHNPSPLVPSNVQPQAGFYTKEALRELQKNSRTLVTGNASRPSDPKPSSEPVIVLKGLLKPSAPEPDGRKSDSDEERDEVEAKFASVGIQNGKGGIIPDEETIKAIRAKRERLRQARPAALDYISLDGGSNHGAAEGLSDEEPEFRGRIAMFGEKVEGGKKGVFEVVDERGVEERFKGDEEVVEEEDEEEKMWEEEQFRKGLGKRMDDGTAARVGGGDVPVVKVAQKPKFVVPPVYGAVPNVAVAAMSTSIGGAIPASPALKAVPMSQQAEIANKAMLDNMRKLKVLITNII